MGFRAPPPNPCVRSSTHVSAFDDLNYVVVLLEQRPPARRASRARHCDQGDKRCHDDVLWHDDVRQRPARERPFLSLSFRVLYSGVYDLVSRCGVGTI